MPLKMEQNVLFIWIRESTIKALPQFIIVIFDNSVIFCQLGERNPGRNGSHLHILTTVKISDINYVRSIAINASYILPVFLYIDFYEKVAL